MPDRLSQSALSRSWILTAAFLALLLKLWVAVVTLGTNDADAFYNFGRFIWEHGLLAQYRATPEFNHTPLTGWFCAAAYGLAHGKWFNWILRVPGILADFFSVLLLLQWRETKTAPPTWALMLYALSPVSLMVSGYHGNLDSVMTFLLLLAARECCEDRPMACGVWLGLACNVKVIPLLVAPVFFFFWMARGRAREFFLPAAMCIIAGWAVPLIGLPTLFVSQVLGYGSNWGSWGISYVLRSTGAHCFSQLGFTGLTPAQSIMTSVLKACIIAAALWTAWRRRRLGSMSVFSTLSVVWAAFFVLAPGVGAQYLVWIAPFLLIDSPGWYAAVTFASGIFLAIFYQTISHDWLWHHGASTAELVSNWAGWSLLPWLTLAAYLITRCKLPSQALSKGTQEHDTSSALHGSLR